MTVLFRNPSLYANKVILAPMVRVGSLPMRLLALHSGAGKLFIKFMSVSILIFRSRLFP